MENVLITGGTGLVGTELTKLLKKENYNVRILTRTPDADNEFKWDIKNNYIDPKALENLDYIIHLAGAGIADERWTAKRKQVIIDSRVETANLLYRKIKEGNITLKRFISASGSNFYGAKTTQKIYEETDAAGNDFLGDVCIKWEAAANQFENLNIPVSILRTGIVLSEKGGALEKMLTPVISPLGSGNQYMSWIHINDLCKAYLACLKGELNGVYNTVAPEFQDSTSFSKTLAKAVGKPYLPINVPAFALKLMFGDLSVILLEGSRLSSKKIEKGFNFEFPKLKEALVDLF